MRPFDFARDRPFDFGHRPRARERGAILIDAFLAMGFFGIVLGSWLSLTNTKIKAMGEADRRFRAVQAATSAIAEARDGLRQPGTFAVPGGFNGELKSEPREGGLRALTVTVRWREPGHRVAEESVELSTVAKP